MLNGPHSKKFLSTLSLRRATLDGTPPLTSRADFYPRSPCGERLLLFLENHIFFIHHFYPRSPCGERRGAYRGARQSRRHFYPRSPCGERLRPCHHRHHEGRISIHALLAESDAVSAKAKQDNLKFLSTLSLRRATSAELRVFPVDYFYPRSPCGERLN